MPEAGVPASAPVEGAKVTPVGNAPDSLSVGLGKPLAVTEKEPATPTVNVVPVALVIDGA